MGFDLFLGFVMSMTEQKNTLKEWDVTVLFVAFGLFVGFGRKWVTSNKKPTI